jgi:FtsH-binding integral membrane protein
MFLPFIPGDYDGSAGTLSFMAQLLAFSGLLLVPIGLLWLIHESTKRRKTEGKHTDKNITYQYAISALIASCIVAIIVSLGAFFNNNLLLGIITMAFYTCIVLNIIPKMRQIKSSENMDFNPTPFYLIIIPVIVALVRFMFIAPATEYTGTTRLNTAES